MINKFTNSIKNLPKIIIVLLFVLVLFVVFKAGMEVGYRKASFGFHRDRSYMGARDPHSFLNPFMSDSDDPNPQGAFGQVVSVRLPLVMIKGRGVNEQIVNISSTTLVRNMRTSISANELKTGDFVVIIGEPNEKGIIDASLIRILPPPPSMASSSSSIIK